MVTAKYWRHRHPRNEQEFEPQRTQRVTELIGAIIMQSLCVFCGEINQLREILRMLKRIVLPVIAGLMFSFPAQAAPTIEDYFSNLDSFEARFVQRLFNAQLELEEESRGVIKIKRPDRFYLKYTQPYEQLYIADGEKLWSYDADLEQIIVKQQKNLLRDTPAMILSNPGNLQRQYRIESYTDEGELNWFRLIPRSTENQFEEIQLGFDAEQIRTMELKDGFGRITRLEFDDIRRNPSFAASTFRFTPPPGVDVIQQ